MPMVTDTVLNWTAAATGKQPPENKKNKRWFNYNPV